MGEWEKFIILGEKVKNLTKSLQEDTKYVKDTLMQFKETLSKEETTSKEWDELIKLSESLSKEMDELRNVSKKAASKDIAIEFVGTTNSGKSSVINALLRERRLPVGFMQTTMCSIRVCVKEIKEWSVKKIDKDGEEEFVSEAIEEKALENLLSKMSGLENEQLRKEKGIDLYTIIQINWPKEKCKKLPENVILCDTPGFGESGEDIQLVTERCKKADIIVAVMDSTSPSKGRLTKLVKDVGCPFTFGVFTKWDECLRKAEKEGDDIVKNVKETADAYEKEFLEALQGKSEVYFVDVENFLEPDSSFKEFERTLATRATELKGKSLTEQAKSIALRSLKCCDRLKKAIEKKKTEKLQRLEEELVSMKKGRKTLDNAFESIKSENVDLQISTSDTNLFEKVSEKLRKGAFEEPPVQYFLETINEKTTKAIKNKRDEISKVYQEWKKHINSRKFQSLNIQFPGEPPQLQHQELPKEQYNCILDPHYYYTSNFFFPCTLGIIVCTIPTAMFVASIVTVTTKLSIAMVTFSGAVGVLGGAAFEVIGHFRSGDKIKKKYPISSKKIQCWMDFLLKELKNHHEKYKTMLREEKKAGLERVKKELESTSDEKESEIVELHSDSHIWNELASRLGNKEDSIRTTEYEFEKLLTEFF